MEYITPVKASEMAIQRSHELVEKYGDPEMYTAYVTDKMYTQSPLSGTFIKPENQIAIVEYTATPKQITKMKGGS